MSKEGEKARIYLQDRDYRLMKLCYEHDFLTLDHFEFEFWLTGAREARRRAQELVAAGFLIKEHSPIQERRVFFRLTKLGQMMAQANSQVKSPPKRHINLNQFRHDALVTLVRQRLDRNWRAFFVPERQLKEDAEDGLFFEKPIVPDGIFEFSCPQGKIAIEVEAADKGKRRFAELLRRWEPSDELYLVLYIAVDAAAADRLKRYILACDGLRQRVAVVNWEDLRRFAPFVWSPPNLNLAIFQFENPIPRPESFPANRPRLGM